MKTYFLFALFLTVVYSKDIDGLSIANSADKYIGLPYIWGGTNLNKGVDCSAFVKDIYKKYGYNIPRTAENQALYKRVKTIKHLSRCKIGDAIYFKNLKNHIHHVALITGFAKDGRPVITHAKGKDFGIVKERMSDKYLSEFIGAKRFYIASRHTKLIYFKPIILKGGS